MVKFGTLDENGKFTDLGNIDQDAIKRCPHLIMDFSHYRPDGTCRCDDPSHLDMGSWGYTWDTEKLQWVA